MQKIGDIQWEKAEIKDEYDRNEKSHIAEVTQKETELKGQI